MTSLHTNRTRRGRSTQYATSEDFCQVFANNLKQLYLLSFLMTGNHELAERCFVTALEEGIHSHYVFSEWAGSWAKRTIVRGAIRTLQSLSRYGNASLSNGIMCNIGESIGFGDFELYRVLALEDLERFVFVMSVLESYSDHECALLIGCSLRDVREARIRALERMGTLDHTDHSDAVLNWHASRPVLAAPIVLGD